MTTIHDEARAAHQSAIERRKSYDRHLSRYRIANTLAIAMFCITSGVIVVAAVEAERVLKREAAINQERVAWAR